MECETNSPVWLYRNIHFTETPHIYICTPNFRTPLPWNSSLKRGFPFVEMTGDFAAKFIWACTFLFVYSLAEKKLFAKLLRTTMLKSICELLLLHLKYCTPAASSTAEGLAKQKQERKKYNLKLRSLFFFKVSNPD